MSESILTKQSQLTDLHLIRSVPNKRNVYQARRNDQFVIVKEFLGKNAQKHYDRELKGIKTLIENQITTPSLIEYQFQDKVGLIVFEFILDSTDFKSLFKQYDDKKNIISTHQFELITLALISLASLYQKGLYQKDLHLENLLIQGHKLLFIDCDSIEINKSREKLDKSLIQKNLSLFCAQFNPSLHPIITNLISSIFPTINTDELTRSVQEIHTKRLYYFLKKLNRETSHHYYQSKPSYLVSILKEKPIFGMIDMKSIATSIFRTKQTTYTDQINKKQQYKVNHYYLNHFRELFKKSSAWQNWKYGQVLHYLDIQEIEPIAIFEKRFCYLNIKSFIVYPLLKGRNISAIFDSLTEGEYPRKDQQLSIVKLFKQLIDSRITHGNLVGSNIIWQDNCFILTELSNMKHHQTDISFKDAFKKDRIQFLNNWQDKPLLQKYLDTLIPNID